MAALNIQAAMSGTAGGVPPAGGIDRGDYSGKSLVLDGANDFLTQTLGTPTANNIFTLSLWFKRSKLGGRQNLFYAHVNANNFEEIGIASDNSFFYQKQVNSLNTTLYESTLKLRDTHAFQHLVVTVDTSAVATDKMRAYIDNVEIDAWDTETIYNDSTTFINSAVQHSIGRRESGGSQFWNGYVSKVDFIDGTALDPTSFGQFSATTGKWVIKDTSALTFGNNGFSLDFNNERGVDPDDKDTIFDQAEITANHPTANDWTGNSLLNPESFTRDTPVDNYATLNVLTPQNAGATNGNRTISNQPTNFDVFPVTMPVKEGETLYLEVDVNTVTGNYPTMGLCNARFNFINSNWMGINTDGMGQYSTGIIYENSIQQADFESYTTGDRLAIYVDNLNHLWYLGKIASGTITWFNSADPNAQPPTGGFAYATGGDGDHFFCMTNHTANVGKATIVVSPDEWEANIVNIPEHTTSLTATGLPQPANFFPQNNANIVLYDGTAAEKDVLGMNFSPDFVWSKNRDATASHNVQDAVRGEGRNIQTDSVGQESISDISGVLSFVTPIASDDGFRLGTSAEWNTANARYWSLGIKANGAGVANTSGDIPSIVSTDGTGNFSIVTYEGTGTAGTIGHGLGVVPDMIIVKKRTGSSDWQVYHSANTGTLGTAQPKTQALILNKNVSSQTASTVWNNTKPDINVFTVGTAATINVSPQEYVAYCFKFGDVFDGGSYIGNGSTDGSFVPGDEMLMLMLKRTDTLKNWYIYDQVRDTFNPSGSGFFPDSPNPEFNAASLDFLSNGIKLRTGDGSLNVGRFIWFGVKKNSGSLSA